VWQAYDKSPKTVMNQMNRVYFIAPEIAEAAHKSLEHQHRQKVIDVDALSA